MISPWVDIALVVVASGAALDAFRVRRRLRSSRETLALRERETHLLSESPELSTILRHAHGAISRVLPVSQFDLYVIDDAGRVAEVWGLGRSDDGTSFPQEDPASPHRGQRIDSIRLRDLTATETERSFAPRDLLAGGPASRRLRLPLYSGDRLVAHIEIESTGPIGEDAKSNVRALLPPLTSSLHASRNWTIAVTDELSGLASRRYFETRLSEEWSRWDRYGTPVALAIFDLDSFKGVNDSFGHAAGDQAIRRFGQVVKSEIRSSDVASRWGGEEFAVLFVQGTGDAARAVCERVRRKVGRDRFETDGRRFRITVSAGVAEARAGEPRERLLARADQALYRAKENGRDRVEVSGDDRPRARKAGGR